MTAIALSGGEADGAWFEGHQLKGAPETVTIGISVDGQVALFDLPDDTPELGERLLVYRRQSVGHVCGRHGKHRGCTHYATYVPADNVVAHR